MNGRTQLPNYRNPRALMGASLVTGRIIADKANQPQPTASQMIASPSRVGQPAYWPKGQLIWGKPRVMTLAYPATQLTIPGNFAVTGITKDPLTAEGAGMSLATPHQVQIKMNSTNLFDQPIDFDVFVQPGKPGMQLPWPYLLSKGSVITVNWEGTVWSEITSPSITFHGFFIDLENKEEWSNAGLFFHPHLYNRQFNFDTNNETLPDQIKIDPRFDFELLRMLALVKTYTQNGPAWDAAIVSQPSWDVTGDLVSENQYHMSDNDQIALQLWMGDREYPNDIIHPLLIRSANNIDLKLTAAAASATVAKVVTIALWGRHV